MWPQQCPAQGTVTALVLLATLVLTQSRCPWPCWPPGHTWHALALHLSGPHTAALSRPPTLSRRLCRERSKCDFILGKIWENNNISWVCCHVTHATDDFLAISYCAWQQSSQFVGTAAHTSFQRLGPYLSRRTFLAVRGSSLHGQKGSPCLHMGG